MRPGERGPLPTYCGDCRELRHTVNRLQGILKRRPDLREVMERELCVRVSKAPQSGPRPAYRETRIELHLSDWVRMTLKRLKYETGRTLSELAEDALRVGLGYPVDPADYGPAIDRTIALADLLETAKNVSAAAIPMHNAPAWFQVPARDLNGLRDALEDLESLADDPCEGCCGRPATRTDEEGVRLCEECQDPAGEDE